MEQHNISLETHGISTEKIDPHALEIIRRLQEAGFVAYIVGGSIRDLLLGHTPKDFDISTSARPEEIKSLFRNSILIGRRFRLAHIRFGKKIFEVSTFRTGDLETEELILRDNQWGYPEEDALRRDFTINGLFYDPSTEEVIDYVGGYADIKKKVLRTIGVPHARFKQDPVRMLRLLKFQARFNLSIDSDALIALTECRAEIVKSSQARVFEELLRMLESGAARRFIELLSQHGLLAHLLPELANFIEREPKGTDIYEYLHEADSITLDPSLKNLDRTVLMGALAFPLFEVRIHSRFVDRGINPHLGLIAEEARDLIDQTFGQFFLIPRKMKFGLVSLLSGQYRLTPLIKKKADRRRIPRDPDFGLAIDFLGLRTYIEPGLRDVFERWAESFARMAKTRPDQEESEESRPPRRKRRRKRARPA